MGGAIAKATIRQAARAAARQVTKKTVKMLAVRGAKGVARGALTLCYLTGPGIPGTLFSN